MPNIQDQLKEMRTLVQEMGWEAFMMHVGSLMAEQADKTPPPQSGALFSASRMIHILPSIWTECGTFQYPEDMINQR